MNQQRENRPTETKALAPWVRTNLTARYLGGLGLVALLMIASETYMHTVLRQQDAVHEVATLLFNRIQTNRWLRRTLERLEIPNGAPSRNRDAKEFSTVLEALEDNRNRLVDTALNLKNLNLRPFLERLKKEQQELAKAVLELQTRRNDSLNEQELLNLQDLRRQTLRKAQEQSAEITDWLANLREYANQQISRMNSVERVVFLIVLLTLALEAAFVFRPAVTTLSKAVEKLENTQRELSHEKIKAEQAAGIRSEFIGRMSHEIRNPMNTVLGMAELLGETPLSIEQSKYLQVMKRSGKALLDFMNDILDFSKLGAGEIDIEMREVNLIALIEAISDIISPQSFERNIEFILDIDPNIPRRFWGDRRRLQQILINLLQNALKFTDHGSITLKAEYDKKAELLTLSVIDTGIGIPDEAKSKVFESFYQVSSGRRRKAGGAGLGLSISKMLIEKMGGKIEFESTFGKGSRFFVTFKPSFASFAPLASSKLPNHRRVWVNLSHSKVAQPVIRYLNSFVAATEVATDLSKIDLIVTDDVELAKKYRDRSIVAVPIAGADDSIRICKANGLQMLFLPIKPSELEEILKGETKHGKIERAKSQIIVDSHATLSGRLLIVDDSPDNHLVLKAFVGKEKFEIDSAYNGQEAIDLILAGNHYDLILMDVQMPILDGYEATRIIRKIERERHRPSTPIIIVTALDDETERELAHISGCTERLVKPVSQASLLSVIRSALKSKFDDNVIALKEIKDERISMPHLNEIHADLRKLIPNYISNRSQEIEEMLEWQKRAEFDRIQASAHKIRGNAATFGFARLGTIAEEIEKQCKSRHYDSIPSLLDALKLELETTGSALKKELAASSSP